MAYEWRWYADRFGLRYCYSCEFNCYVRKDVCANASCSKYCHPHHQTHNRFRAHRAYRVRTPQERVANLASAAPTWAAQNVLENSNAAEDTQSGGGGGTSWGGGQCCQHLNSDGGGGTSGGQSSQHVNSDGGSGTCESAQHLNNDGVGGTGPFNDGQSSKDLSMSGDSGTSDDGQSSQTTLVWADGGGTHFDTGGTRGPNSGTHFDFNTGRSSPYLNTGGMRGGGSGETHADAQSSLSRDGDDGGGTGGTSDVTKHDDDGGGGGSGQSNQTSHQHDVSDHDPFCPSKDKDAVNDVDVLKGGTTGDDSDTGDVLTSSLPILPNNTPRTAPPAYIHVPMSETTSLSWMSKAQVAYAVPLPIDSAMVVDDRQVHSDL